ncbi:fungal-specific transcription factor domain-containing protein [Aspergillus unguis]
MRCLCVRHAVYELQAGWTFSRFKRPKICLEEPSRLHFVLPSYIKAPPLHITDDDLRYIQVKGVLNLPCPATCEKLWKAYFLLVHPIIPILDREQVLQSLHLIDSTNKISLLLFYCVMSTAQLFLDAQEGCGTISASAQSMFEKARVLHDLHWETDQLTILRSVLLMTYFPRSTRGHRNPGHWVSTAVSVAYRLNLHRDPAALAISPRQKSLRKLIWWCVYIRERMLILDFETPWIICERDYDVPMLTMDDIALAPLLPTPPTSKPGSSNVDYVTQQRQLGIIFIEKAKLAVLMSRLVPISMTSWDWAEDDFDHHWPRYPPRAPDLLELDQIDGDLDCWIANIPIEVLGTQESLTLQDIASARDNLTYLHYGTLILLYHIASHHSASLRWLQSAPPSHLPSEYTLAKAMEATASLVDLIEDLALHRITTYVQLTGLSVARPLLMWKILNHLGPDCPAPLESKRISFLLEKLEHYDPWVTRAFSYIASRSRSFQDAEFIGLPTCNAFDAASDDCSLDTVNF